MDRVVRYLGNPFSNLKSAHKELSLLLFPSSLSMILHTLVKVVFSEPVHHKDPRRGAQVSDATCYM